MDSIILITILVLSIILVIFLNRSSQNQVSRFFQLAILCHIFWTLTIWLTTADSENALFWSRCSFFFAIGITLSLHPFTYNFSLHSSHKSRNIFSASNYTISYLFYGLGAVMAGLSFTPLILKDVVSLQSTFGPLQPLYSLFMLGSFGYTIYLLYQAQNATKSRVRSQYQLILTGIAITACLSIASNLIIPFLGLAEIRFLGPLSMIFFLSATTYAIIAHHLFDIRVIIKRTIIYSTLLLLILASYSMIVFVLTALLGGTRSFTSTVFFTNLGAAVLISIGFDPLRRLLQAKTERVLFKREYEQQEILKGLSEKLNNVVALDEALETVMQAIVKSLRLAHAVTYVFQPAESGSIAIKRIKQIGYKSTSHLFIQNQDFLISYFTQTFGIIVVDKLEQEIEQEKNYFQEGIETSGTKKKKSEAEMSAFIREHAVKQSVLKRLRGLNAALAVPLHLNGQPLGLIVLSGKLSQLSFSQNDLALIELVAAHAISSIQKAKLYEGDQIKSEFVSIASHELLTPISAIEGYLSMILDENIGKIDGKSRDYLGKVYSSAKRLSLLIKDLLSVSRIEAGRLKIEAQSLDMEKMINDTINQLKFIAQEKNLALTFEVDTHPLPAVWADPDRTMQILVNLVSNAIKYTSKGSVTISASVDKASKRLNIEIKDTGIGMSKQAQYHLFEKFYRVASSDTVGVTGTGLGLYITKSILEKMNSSIKVSSKAHQGSAFSFSLPLFQVELSTLQ